MLGQLGLNLMLSCSNGKIPSSEYTGSYEGVLLIAMVVCAYFFPTEHSGYTQSRAGMELCSFLGAGCFPFFPLFPPRLQPLSYGPVMEL